MMKPSLRNPLAWLLAFFISLVLFYLSFYSYQLSWIAKPEEFITSMPSNFKHWTDKASKALSKNDQHYIENNFILVNTAKDQAIIEEDAGSSVPKTIAITDRAKLAKLFRWLDSNKHLYRLAVCDLQFVDSGKVRNSAENMALESAIHGLLRSRSPQIIFAGEYDDVKYKPSIFPDINASGMVGNTAYNVFEKEDFLDYSLLTHEGHVKSLPLLLYEKVGADANNSIPETERQFKNGWFGTIWQKTAHGKKYIWNNFVPEIYFGQEDMEDIEKFHSYETNDSVMHSTTMIRLGSAVGEDFALEAMCQIKGKTISGKSRKPIIFIGSFSGYSDTHSTLFGQTAGSLILLNIFHTLDTCKDNVKTFYLLFLFTMLFLISVDVVFQGPKFTRKLFFILSLAFFGLPLLILMSLGAINNYFKRMLQAAIHWIKEESHYFVLLLTGIIANLVFDRLINCIILAFLVFITDKLFQFAEDPGKAK
jgi:hypothetical protein